MKLAFEQKENPWLSWLRCSLLTLLLVFALFFGFVNVYYNAFFETPVMSIWIASLCIAFCALFVFVPRKRFVWISILGLSAILILIFRKFFAYSFMSVCNQIPYAISDFFGIDVICFDIKTSMKEYIHEGWFITFAMTWLVALYAFCICEHKVFFLPYAVNFAGVIFPIILNYTPPVWNLSLQIAALSSLVCLCATTIDKKSMAQRKLAQRTAAGMAVSVLLIGNILGVIRPIENFENHSAWKNIKTQSLEELQELINAAQSNTVLRELLEKLNIKPSGEDDTSITNDIGGGMLGQAGKIEFSGNEVLRMTVRADIGKIYLRGYVASDYVGMNSYMGSAHWDTLNDMSLASYQKNIWEELGLSSQNQIFYLTNLEKELLKGTDWTGIRSLKSNEAILRFTGLKKNRQYMPMYPNARFNQYFPEGQYQFADEDAELEFYAESISDIIELAKGFDYLLDYNKDEQNDQDTSDSQTIADYDWAQQQYRDMVYENYLDVNTDCDEFLYELTASFQKQADATLEKDSSTYSTAMYDYNIAAQICTYLANSCEYSLEPGVLPDGKDFVSYFLTETHKGYCTYFASAAVMLLRAAGIPARYVEGYVVETNGANCAPIVGQTLDRKVFSVTDDFAHAWVEFYIDGIGWVQYDMTPGVGDHPTNPEPATEPETDSEEPTNMEPETESEKETTTGTMENSSPISETGETTTKGGANGANAISLHKLFLYVGICLIPLLIAQVIVLLVARAKRKEKRFMVRMMDHEADQNELIRLNYARCERILKYVGFKQRSSETFGQFANRLGTECTFLSAEDADTILTLYEKVLYSTHTVTRVQVEEMIAISQHLSHKVYSNVNLFKKVAFRYILNLYI